MRKVTVICDYCRNEIAEDDEEAGELSISEMDGNWDITGSMTSFGDMCSNCIKKLTAWKKHGGVPAT